MTDIDPNEIEEVFDKAEEVAGIKEPQFKGEIYLSTDGKHTVHIEADTKEGRKAGGLWALEAYKWIAKELGTKAEMWKEAMNGKKEEPTLPKPMFKCEACAGDAIEKSGETNGKKWKGVFCQNEDCKKVKWLSTKEVK